MADSTDQIVSFFAYSLFVYPVTNYIVSPQRGYSRRRAAIYAIIFLATVAILHMMYESGSKGPNFYEILNVKRDTALQVIKKNYRLLSLELHPDKNKAHEAAEKLQQVQQAFDVLTDREKRKEYNRLGEQGLKVLTQTVIDHKYILLQIIVQYFSLLVFAFLMTFSESSGEVFSITLFGLATMLLIEMVLVLQEVVLPGWFLPQTTAHEIVVVLHRLFPAFMNGVRCIAGAFQIDHKNIRVLALDNVAAATKDVNMRMNQVTRLLDEALHYNPLYDNTDGDDDDINENEDTDQTNTNRKSKFNKKDDKGIMFHAMQQVRRRLNYSREVRDGSVVQEYKTKLEKVNNSKPGSIVSFGDKDTTSSIYTKYVWLRDLAIYLFLRYLLIKDKE